MLSASALVVACFGIAFVLPWLFDLRGSVAKIVVRIGSPVLTIIIGMALRITPVDNPVAFLFLFGGIALLLALTGRAWQARTRGQFSNGDATNLPRPSGDTPQPNPIQEASPAYLRSKESVKPEKEEAGEDTGSEASTTIKTLNRGKFLRGLGRFALLVGLFLFFGMAYFGTAWESVKMLWLQAPWVAIPMLATPDHEILPFIIAVIYSAPFFALGGMMFALGYILIRFSRPAAHAGWLLVPVAAWLLVLVLCFLYGCASWVAGMVGYFRFLLG